MSATLLPQIGTSRRSSSEHRLSERRKTKTLASESSQMNAVVQAKLRLGRERNQKKLATQVNAELQKHYHKEELRRNNEAFSSDEQQQVRKGIHKLDDMVDSPQLKLTPRPPRTERVRSLQSQRTVTLQNESLVGKEAVSKFYNVHKGLDRVEELELLNGKLSPITLILRLLEDLHIPPRKLQFIKESGSRNILDLKNCGLGRGNNSLLLNEILSKIGNFDALDISHNSIHLDTADRILPFVGQVRHFDASHNKIGKDGCQILGKLFANKTTKIERIELQSNQLSDAAAVQLLRPLAAYTKLKILNLSRNFLSKDSGVIIGKLFQEPQSSLAQLYLHWNELNQQASMPIFESLSHNGCLRVLDFSWNYQRDPSKMLPALKKFLETNKTCIHVDLSYCCFSYEHSRQIKKSLSLNNTIFGFHFEGNHGHIDSRGNLILEDRSSRMSDMVQYPMPLHKPVARRIRGCQPCHDQQLYGVDQKKNICWLCSDYQQFEFRLPKPFGMSGTECFVHLDREFFRGFKLLQKDNEFFLKKMIPRGHHRFFFTLGRDQRVTSEHYQEVEGVFLDHYKIGKVKFQSILIPKLNIINMQTTVPVLDLFDFQPNVECRPRQKVSKINLKNLVLRKRLIERLQKMKFSLKELPQVVEYRPNESQQLDCFRSCIEYDFQNSKLSTILMLDKHQRVKDLLLKYYKEIWCAFDWLSSLNATDDGIFSIPQPAIIEFAQEVRYVTKRIPIPKIILKYVSSLRKDGTMRRSQFVQFLVRLAEQKWAREDKQYFKSSFYQATLELESRKSIRKQSIRKESRDERKGSFKLQLVRQQSNNDDSNEPQEHRASNQLGSEDESQCRSIGKRERETLPIQEGLERLLRPLVNYYLKYTPQSWRKARYMTPDIRLLLDAYHPFLLKLFEKYAKTKVYNRKKVIGYYDFVSMFMKAGVVATRSKFDQGERSFIMSRVLEPNDTQGFALTFDEHNECLARVAQAFSLPPIGFSDRQLFHSEKPRSQLPLVFKMQSLLNILFRGHPELSTAKLVSMFEDGIFRQEIETYIEIATQRYMNEPELILEPKINTRIRFNNLSRLTELTLKDLIEALKLKYSNMVIRRYSVVEELQEDDEEDEDPPE